MKVERQLLEHGKVSRGRLGISIQDVSADLAEAFGMDKASGAAVASVERGGPADKAGIEPGDVVIDFDGHAIARSNELPPLVSDVAPGKRVAVKVWRRGKTLDLQVTVGELNASDTTAQAPQESTEPGRLGLAVHPLNAQERREANVTGGLMVDEVQDGPAEQAGIQSGDVILAVNGEPVSTIGELRSRVGKASKRLALLVQRGNARLFVPIHLG
jgi:serine protease Do